MPFNFLIGWPYAAKAIIQHEFDIDHLNIWLTFSQAMNSNYMPAIDKWLVYVDTVEKPATVSSWQDAYTLLLMIPDIAANPTRLLVKYNGPDENLRTSGGLKNFLLHFYRGKQWESFGSILSYDISS
jgi:hypothetical protein